MSLDMSAYQTCPGGLLLLQAKDGFSLSDFRGALSAKKAALQRAIGADVETRIGVRFEKDPLAEMYGDRTMATADAIVDVAMPEGKSPADLASRMAGLRELSDCVDFSGSAIGLGTICYIRRSTPEGGEALHFLGRKAPETTLDGMRRWWLLQHAALVARLQGSAPRPWSYGQLHVDHDASKAAAHAAGTPYVEYDMGDVLPLADRQAFFDFHRQPDVVEALEKDEMGFLDQSSWRGGLVKVI